jgi:hypothetical protein
MRQRSSLQDDKQLQRTLPPPLTCTCRVRLAAPKVSGFPANQHIMMDRCFTWHTLGVSNCSGRPNSS